MGESAIHLEICADRACTQVEQVVDADADAAAPAMALAHGVHFWHARSGSGPYSAPWEFWVGSGTSSRDTSWGAVPDINGDGRPDVLVAGEYNLWAYLNTASGLPGTPTHIADVAVLSLSAIGDVNGDGFVDVATDRSLWWGSANGLESAMPTAGSLVGVGDVNGDGYGDVVSGTSVRLGSATGLAAQAMTLAPPSPLPPGDVKSGSAGDFNGDGFADIVVAYAPSVATAAGTAYVYLGSASGPSSTPIQLPAPSNAQLLGFFMTGCAGDFNGDGYADIALSGNGRAFVYPGSASGMSAAPITLAPSRAAAQFAVDMAAAGDVNGDGFGDVIVGDWGASTAYVYFGNTIGTSGTPRVLIPSDTNESFGYSVAGAGDLNGDGLDDLLIGAPGPLQAEGMPAVSVYDGSVGAFGPPTILQAPGITAPEFGMHVAIRDRAQRRRSPRGRALLRNPGPDGAT